jgi:hypothetical protein
MKQNMFAQTKEEITKLITKSEKISKLKTISELKENADIFLKESALIKRLDDVIFFHHFKEAYHIFTFIQKEIILFGIKHHKEILIILSMKIIEKYSLIGLFSHKEIRELAKVCESVYIKKNTRFKMTCKNFLFFLNSVSVSKYYTLKKYKKKIFQNYPFKSPEEICNICKHLWYLCDGHFQNNQFPVKTIYDFLRESHYGKIQKEIEIKEPKGFFFSEPDNQSDWLNDNIVDSLQCGKFISKTFEKLSEKSTIKNIQRKKEKRKKEHLPKRKKLKTLKKLKKN